MWFKKLRQRKLQSAIIFFIVFICSMLMTSSLVIMTSLNKPYQDLIKECNSPKVKVYPLDMSKEQLEQVRKQFDSLKLTTKAIIINYHYLVENLIYKDKLIDGFLSLVEYNNDIHKSYRIIDGTALNLGENECLISTVITNENNIKINDIITISYLGKTIDYKVKGIYTDPYNMSLAYDNEIVVKEIPEGFNRKQYISVFGNQEDKGIQLVNEYRDNNNGVLEGRGETVETRITNNSITEKILGGILLAVSFIILIVSCVMIRYMIRNALLNDKKTIAIFKTMGYTNHSIISIYMKLYLFLVISGSVVGAISSAFISDSFMVETYKNLGEVKRTSTVLSGFICVFLIASFVMLQVYHVLTKMKNIKPVIVLNGKEVDLGKKKRVGNSIFEKLSFSPLGMALRMLQRDKKNTCYIILTCIVSIYCVNFALTCFSNITNMNENNYYWIGFDKHDVSVTSITNDEFESAINQLKQEKETERVILTTTDIKIMLPWNKGMGDPIVPTFVYETYENINMPVLEGRNPRYSNEIVISNLLSRELKKQVGDYIDIYLNVDKKVSLLITGIYQSYYNLGRGCRLLGSTFYENGVNVLFNEASVYLKAGIDKKEYINKYSQKYKDYLEIIDRQNKHKSIIDMICDPQMKAITPFMIMALLLGAMNIIAIVYLKNQDNKKINTIYQCIGYSTKHLIQGNLIYISIVVLCSMAITVPLFMISFPKSMVLSLSMFGFKKYLADYNVFYMLVGNVCAILVFLVSTFLSSRNLYKNNISDLNQE